MKRRLLLLHLLYKTHIYLSFLAPGETKETEEEQPIEGQEEKEEYEEEEEEEGDEDEEIVQVDQEIVAEEVEEEEGAGEEEGDWEWEYYEDEDGSKAASEEGVAAASEPPSEPPPPPPVIVPEVDVDAPWILKGLNQVIPRVPNKSDSEKIAQEADYSDDEEDEEETGQDNTNNINDTSPGMNIAVSASDLLVDKEKGYKEWIEECAQLHEGAHLHLQAEIEAEEDLLKSVGSNKDESDKNISIAAIANSKVSKASR